jgi:trans-aconitate methyltransferase
MELQQAISLIKNPHIISTAPQVWADLGCGEGLFTQALAGLLAPGSTIYAVDQNKRALQQLPQQEGVLIKPILANFVNDRLPFTKLNGILMANALHFVPNQKAFIKKLEGYVADKYSVVMVEYDTDTPNQWVPYPLSFTTLQNLFKQSGYATVQKIHEQPSLYGRANIYSAIIEK